MREAWRQAIAEQSPEMRAALLFLYDHLPESDLDCYPVSLMVRFAEHALALRRQAPWCAALDQEIFDHYVLFPRVNDEDLSFHRELFHNALWPRLQSLPAAEDRVLAVNRWCHEIASYQSQDDRTASPLTVYRSGSGRCGEESAFLVSALRSVGIPARQVYAPRWAHCDDNHAWVEALCDGQWRFLGACEPEPILDRGWFNAAASQAILVHSRLFGAGVSPLHGELLCREGIVGWYNQTARYAPVRTYTFRALREGKPASGAVFHLQVLNEAGFHTIASLTADEHGQAQAALGMGDIHVLAIWQGLCAEGDCAEGGLTLHLAAPPEDDAAPIAFDVLPPRPAAVNPAPLDAHQRRLRGEVLREGSALRKRRLSALDCSAGADPRVRDLISAARGNGGTMAAFLNRDGHSLREALLRTLTDKDLRDAGGAVLEDHLQNAPAQGDMPDSLYLPYVLCPRIALEPLTDWRGRLLAAISPARQDSWRASPASLWTELLRRTELTSARTYARLVWAPWQAWQNRRCDLQSLRILFVAVLRALGVPARLRPLDGRMEYWQSGAFRCVLPEQAAGLLLSGGAGGSLAYRQNWTLSRWTEEGWQLLSLPDEGWLNGTRRLSLAPGRYRLITSVRLNNGRQFATRQDVCLRPGQTRAAALSLRSYALEDMLCSKELPAMPAVTPEGERLVDISRITGRPSLLIWLEDGAEPTEHVLNELYAGWERLAALPVEIVLLVRTKEILRHPTLCALAGKLRGLRLLMDEWAYDLETVARLMTCDPDTPPLCVVCDGSGRAVYGVSGYRVGSVELLTRVAAHLVSQSI